MFSDFEEFLDMMRATVILLSMFSCTVLVGAELSRDIAYDTKHERNVLDFWPAVATDRTAPVFVWFHGGGFQTGDKSDFEKNRAACLRPIR